MGKYILPFLKMVGFLLIYYIMYGMLNSILSLILKCFIKNPMQYPSAIAAAISVILSVIIFKSITKITPNSLKLDFNNSGAKAFLKGIKNGLIYATAIIFILFLTCQAGISAHTRYDKGFYYTLISEVIFFFVFVCASEILYRGCILNYLKSKYTTSGAIIISSLIYAGFSVFNGHATPLSLLNNFLFGCILCIIVLKYDSLNHAIGLRFAFGTMLYFLFSFNNHGASSMGIFNFPYKNMEILNGGGYGIEGGLIFTICASILILFLYRSKIINNEQKGIFAISKKNLSIALFLTIVTILYIVYDVSIWKAEDRKFDTSQIKSVEKYENANNYSMDWILDVNNKKISGTEEIEYINTSQDNLNEVYFHMYAAAFKKYNGDIKILNVMVNGISSKFNITGSDGTLLYIPLENVLVPGKRVKIQMRYVIDIPQRSNNGFADRFAYSNNAINLGNCFPIAAVYENGSFDTHTYDEKGDAFYSETSNFSVTVTAPSDYTLAVTGNAYKTQAAKNDNKKWFITANSVRDFALVASNKLQMVQGNVNGTIIKSYAYNKSKAQKALNISVDAIKTYNKRFGEYPYGTCSVVETDLNGGMEYPTMVMILSSAYDDVNLSSIESKIMYGRTLGEFEFVLVHELAHQWWYGLIGDDEFHEAYVDEPLAQFSSLLYIKDKYGEKAFNTAYDKSIVLTNNLLKSSVIDTNYKRPLNEFTNENEYTEIIYQSLPMKIKEYYDKVGDSNFNSILQDTFKKYEFKVLKGKDYPIPLD